MHHNLPHVTDCCTAICRVREIGTEQLTNNGADLSCCNLSTGTTAVLRDKDHAPGHVTLADYCTAVCSKSLDPHAHVHLHLYLYAGELFTWGDGQNQTKN